MELAKYSLIFKSENNGCLLINTMTNSIVRFDSLHANRLYEVLRGGKDLEIESFLEKNKLSKNPDFVRAFLSDKYNSLFCYKDVMDVCIFTSLRCNLNCPYCYESHNGPITGDDVYKALEERVRFDAPRVLLISWFGGEPLLNKDSVLLFSDRMKQIQNNNGGIFKSGITTNGTLLDKETAKQLIDSGVVSFQVTVDGPKEVNDASRIRPDGKGTFDQIMANLDSMKTLKEAFTMIVRCNVSDKNILATFCEVFKEHFSDDSRFSLHFYPVSDWKNIGKACMAKSLNIFSINEIVLEKGLRSALLDSIHKEGFFCQFGYPGKFVVFPDGTLGDCTIKATKKPNLNNGFNADFENPPSCKNLNCYLYPKCFGRQCRHGQKGEEVCEAMRKGVEKFYKRFAEVTLHEEVSLLV